MHFAKKTAVRLEKSSMNKLSKQNKRGDVSQWVGAVCVLAALFQFLDTASAMYAYLPMVGAPELRFQEVTTNSFNYLAFKEQYAALQAKMAEAISNATALAAAKDATNSSSSAATSPVAANSTPKTGSGNISMPNGANANPGANVYISTSQDSTSDDGKNSRLPSNFVFPGQTASDMLTVTPQMLTQYLKPGMNETNSLDRPGVVVFVPADMPFEPPAQKPAPESRAIYQSR